jgi:hypothetical protein
VGVARINLGVTRRDEAGMDLDFGMADACVRAFTSRGLRLDMQLFPPSGPGIGPVTPGHPDARPGENPIYPMLDAPYRHLVRETARRYGRSALFFQVGNEPGNALQYRGRPDEYVVQFRQAAEELHAALPGMPVTNGGYCMDNADTHEIARALGSEASFVSYHWHGYLEGLAGFQQRIRDMLRAGGAQAAPLANTEMGLAVPTVGAERANAVAELQKLLYCWAHGHAGVLLYSSRELWWPRQFSYDGVSDYGFVDHFFCPRFVYGAVSALLDRYAGCRFERISVEEPDLHAYVFRRGETRLLALFAPRHPVDVLVTADTAARTVLDPMGNERCLSSVGGVRLRVGEYPITVVYPRPGAISVARAAEGGGGEGR